MADLIQFELTTPERRLVDKPVSEAILPTRQGEIAVLPGHVPLVAVLQPGLMTLRTAEGEEEYLAVDSGFVEVLPGNRVVILADGADRAEELDLEKVEEARRKAEQDLEKAREADQAAVAAMMASLNREMARVKAVRKHRSHRPGPGITS
jgi:F-type H+-transporting ATPase subunit epsilon